ncbi:MULTISPECIES: hypothetical protein [unclassified Sutcliffiella]|uniref:hypothetical protein n=1 Tax=unclassified Sutcliffiella TaxID=2837532 RepID=UPI0030D0FB89
MISNAERLLFIRGLGRLQKDFKKCSDNPVRNAIHQDILLLRKTLSITARN